MLVQSAKNTSDVQNQKSSFLEATHKPQELGRDHPAWFHDYEDFARCPHVLSDLLASAPHPFLAGVAFGRLAATT